MTTSERATDMTTTPSTPTAAKKTRKVRTQREVAQDLLDKAKAREHRAKEEATRKAAAFGDAKRADEAARAEVAAATAAVKYAEKHPDLGGSQPFGVTVPVKGDEDEQGGDEQ